MKRQLLILTIIATVFASCKDNRKKDSITDESGIDDSDKFLSLFSELKTSDIHVYTPFKGVSGNLFEGREIDTIYYKYFSFEEYYIPQDKDSKLYSCYKLKLNDNKTGLIVRSPSQYSETAVNLLIWDNQSKSILYKQQLADSFGDEGWFFVQDAWLTDLNKDNYIDIVTRNMD
jgi:hypothetical protein